MIEFETVKNIVSHKFGDDVLILCKILFEEEPDSYFDEDLSETYVIFKRNGVSILYNEEGICESVFFNFHGDEDTAPCKLDVISLNSESFSDNLKRSILKCGFKFIKEISPFHSEFSKINHAFVFGKDNLIIHAEFNEREQLSLLSFMSEESYPS